MQNGALVDFLILLIAAVVAGIYGFKLLDQSVAMASIRSAGPCRDSEKVFEKPTAVAQWISRVKDSA